MWAALTKAIAYERKARSAAFRIGAAISPKLISRSMTEHADVGRSARRRPPRRRLIALSTDGKVACSPRFAQRGRARLDRSRSRRRSWAGW
jgi:hypothetical protein